MPTFLHLPAVAPSPLHPSTTLTSPPLPALSSTYPNVATQPSIPPSRPTARAPRSSMHPLQHDPVDAGWPHLPPDGPTTFADFDGLLSTRPELSCPPTSSLTPPPTDPSCTQASPCSTPSPALTASLSLATTTTTTTTTTTGTLPSPTSTTSPTDPVSCTARSRAEIRRARAARNRSSARRSRLKKKEESERDRRKAQCVERRNADLKIQVQALREQFLALQRVAELLGASVPDMEE